MPDSIERVQLHLAMTFPNIANSPYFEDFARIGSYLSDPNQYRRGLALLHADMEQRFYARLDDLLENDPTLKKLYPNWRDGFRQYFRPLLREKLPKIYKKLGAVRTEIDREKFSYEALAIAAFRKILTDSLKANELQKGFHVGANDDKIDILIGFPEVVGGVSEFNNFLRAKKLFKDLSAGKEHGENSHRIQWYLISKMGTLQHGVAEIYSKLPLFKSIKRPQDSRSFYLWEFLVDRDGVPTNASSIPFKTRDQTDFRAPSNVNRCLCDGLVFPHLDLLIAVLNERWDRRDMYMMDEYLGKKLMPKGLGSNLGPEVLDILRKQVLPGGKFRIFPR